MKRRLKAKLAKGRKSRNLKEVMQRKRRRKRGNQLKRIPKRRRKKAKRRKSQNLKEVMKWQKAAAALEVKDQMTNKPKCQSNFIPSFSFLLNCFYVTPTYVHKKIL